MLCVLLLPGVSGCQKTLVPQEAKPAEMQELLGNGDVSIVFYCAE